MPRRLVIRICWNVKNEAQMKLKNSFCIMRRRANSSLHAFDTCLENKLKKLLQERERERRQNWRKQTGWWWRWPNGVAQNEILKWQTIFWGSHHSSVDSYAPSICLPRFESQAHHLRFFQLLLFNLYNCHLNWNVNRTKIDNERPIFKK